MTGAEADTFITTNIKDYPHLKPYIAKATKTGKKADGFVATVDDDDWEIAIKAQYDVTPGEKLGVNAFIGNQHKDRPAILKADRGTREVQLGREEERKRHQEDRDRH